MCHIVLTGHPVSQKYWSLKLLPEEADGHLSNHILEWIFPASRVKENHFHTAVKNNKKAPTFGQGLWSYALSSFSTKERSSLESSTISHASAKDKCCFFIKFLITSALPSALPSFQISSEILHIESTPSFSVL